MKNVIQLQDESITISYIPSLRCMVIVKSSHIFKMLNRFSTQYTSKLFCSGKVRVNRPVNREKNKLVPHGSCC